MVQSFNKLDLILADVAQLVRALGCGSRGRRFDPGHSPHFSFIFTIIFFLSFLHAETPFDDQQSVVSSVIPDQTAFNVSHQKPQITIIIDQFGMRSDISKKILEQSTSNVILCVPAHCIAAEKFITDAQQSNFNLSLSIDYLNEFQWQKLQEIIEKNPWIKGLVIWSVDPSLKLTDFLTKVKDWLSTRNIWLVYANTNNALTNPDVPTGIFIPDGFIRTTDDSSHVTELSTFVVDQAKLKNSGLLLIELGAQHADPLIKWLQDNSKSIQLNNWKK